MINKPYLKAIYQQLTTEYIATLQKFNDDQINQIPNNVGWSAGQVISHITKANQSSFLGAKGEICTRDIGENLAELELTFLNFDIKMESPDFILPDNKSFTAEESIFNITQCFQALSDALDESEMDEILNSPLGSLTKWEIANFMIFHSKRHLYQLKNIQKSLKIDHKKRLASAFSDGKFEETYAYLYENVVWKVVGENEFSGKQAVVNKCEEVAAYFASVTTNFVTHHVITEGNIVVVNGSGEFLRDGKRVSLISASEWYEFDDNDQIVKINSYCIPEK
jgi:hypothetical protein